jgi:carboxyl-terminal processing protease
VTGKLLLMLACLFSSGVQANWIGKVFAGNEEKSGHGVSHSDNRSLETASEIRQWLLKFNADMHNEISLLQLTRENCEQQLRRIDPYARCYLDNGGGSVADQHGHSKTAGIGAELFKKNGQWWLAPFEGGALYAEGITGRARLLSVGNREVLNMDEEQLSMLLKGAVDTVVCMELERHSQLQTTCVTRSTLKVPTVEHLWDGLLRIRTFRALETRSILQSELERLPAGETLVIDLRESPGGDLFEALDSAALFLPPGTMLAKLKYREGKIRQVLAPESLPTFEGELKLIVGADTASAAEIFAGILQYYGRAQLIGEKTHGKCVSQTILPLSDGSRVKLTNLELYFPDGTTCQGRGLSPDNKDKTVH